MSTRKELRREIDRAINNLDWAERHLSKVGATFHNYNKEALEGYTASLLLAIEDLKKALQKLKEAF